MLSHTVLVPQEHRVKCRVERSGDTRFLAPKKANVQCGLVQQRFASFGGTIQLVFLDPANHNYDLADFCRAIG